MKPKFFPTQSDFRRWLEENYETATEIIVGYYNVKSGKGGMNWSKSVDEALCFGWIDGVRWKIDEESYCNRFTPRRAKSVWSAVNIAKVAELTEKGLMKPAGIAAFKKRQENKSKIYAYENELKQFSGEFEKRFKANERAWEFFGKQANWYRKQMTNWVMTAKQEATREKRLEKLIAESGNEKKIINQMEFLNSAKEDLNEIFRLYDLAIEFQKKVSDKSWLPFANKLIEKEIAEKRHWKIVINDKIACIFSLAFEDPQIWKEKSADAAIYIHRIVTNPEFRGGKFVPKITEWAKVYAESIGKKFVRMDTWGDNRKLIDYYTACGFEFLGVVTPEETEGLPKHYEGLTLSLFEIKLK